jgi:hypothetical protein
MVQVAGVAGRRVARNHRQPANLRPANPLIETDFPSFAYADHREPPSISTKGDPMMRTIFTIGLFAVLGVFALRMVFGILPWLFAILFGLVGWAIKILIIGLIIYAVIRIFSPDSARKMRNWGKDDTF